MRPGDWQFGASVQQQLLPRVSVEVGYFRRWLQNFIVTDNLLVAASNFDAVHHYRARRSAAARRRRLRRPRPLYNVNPAKVRPCRPTTS